MKKYILTALIVCLITQVHAQDWKVFTDTAGNFTATYPASWTSKIKENNKVFFTSPSEGDNDMFRQNVNIIVTKSASLAGYTIRDIAPDMLKNIGKQFESYEQVSNKYFTWNGVESFELIYHVSQPGDTTRYRIKQWMQLSNGVLYMVTYTAPPGPDAMAETADRILRSIKF